ncbi:MAG: AAA family ATPase [Candidatus Dormibacteraeota bacterium]|nr:AAA family ATPase [Candidatus Dormibacteraeota bacterium]
MVGRDRELARLEAAALAAVRGDSRVAVVRGDTGVGKSRLATEATSLAATLGMVVLKGECSESDLSLPYLPIVEAIAAHLSDDAVRAELRAALGDEAAPLARILPQLRAHERFDTTGTSLDKLRLFESVVLLLRAIAASRGLLLLIEDVHWADPATQELLDHVVRRLQSSGTLLVLTLRESELERGHPVRASVQRWVRAGADPLDLRPLDVDDLAAMTSAILDVESTPLAIAARLHERTDGLPLAVEELLRQAIEHGIGDVSRSGWDAVALADVPTPRTLTDAFLLRAERLDRKQLEVARAAAVLGRSFDFTALQRMTSLPDGSLIEMLDTFRETQLIEEDQRRDNGYRFRHILIRDAIYNDILISRRRLMHARAAEAVHATRPDDPSEVAHHLIAAGRAEEAARACVDAAEAALRRLAPRDAMELFAQALAHSSDAGDQARLRCSLGEAAFQAGDIPAAQEQLELGVTALEDRGDAVTAAHHRLTLGRCFWLRSDYAEAKRQYEMARAGLEDAGPSEDLALAYIRLSGLHATDFDAEEAQRLGERAIAIAEQQGSIEQRVSAADWLGVALCLAGKLDAGIAELERSRKAARLRGFHVLESTALIHMLSMLETYGRVEACPPLIARLRALPENPWVTTVAPYYESWLALWAARLIDAARAAQQCIDLASGFGMQGQAGWGRGLLCLVAIELGDVEAARELLPQRTESLQRQERVEQGWVAMRFHLATDDLEQAEPIASEFAAEPWAVAGTALSDAVVYALLALGRRDEAAAFVAAVAAHPRAAMHPGQLLRSKGRLAMDRGEGPAAADLLNPAVNAFAAGGYRLEVLRTKVLLGRALGLTGDLTAAGAALQEVADEAVASSAILLARAAASTAAEAGIRLSTGALDAVSLAAALGHEDDAVPSRAAADETMTAVVVSTRDPQAAASDERATALRRWASLAVEQHHGVIDLHTAETVAAGFNVGGWHEDHARHALNAALEILRGAERLGVELSAGIASGPRSATSTGALPAADVAVRLLAIAGRGEILITEEAFERLRTHLPDGVATAEAVNVPVNVAGASVAAVRLRVLSPRGSAAAALPAPAAAGNSLTREGEFWTLTYAGRVVRLKDTKGLRDLARLLSTPGIEIAAVDLAGAATPIGAARGRGATDAGLAPQGDAGEVLDERARQEYRQRLVDLEAEVNDAEAANDPERASRARQERDFIIDELGAAVGLMGKSRRALDPAERARKAVTWRLRETITRIAASDAELGRHLRHSVRTGAFCVYDPPVPTRWTARR